MVAVFHQLSSCLVIAISNAHLPLNGNLKILKNRGDKRGSQIAASV
jgi:hypothetical protein